MNLWRPAIAGLSRAGTGARLTVTIFHRVTPQPDPLFPEEHHAESFEVEMRRLREWFNVLPLGEAIAGVEAGSLPARSLAITFDDGYANNYTVALPILKRLGLSATFFLATGFLDGGRMWNDTVLESIRRFEGKRLDLTDLGLSVHSTATIPERRRAIEMLLPRIKSLPSKERSETAQAIAQRADVVLPEDLMLTSAQVRDMHAQGMEIGAHTVSHPILAKLPDAEARREIAESRTCLEALLKTRVDLFAYPNGKPGDDYCGVHADMTRELGFRAAFSTMPGTVRRDGDRYQLPRFTPWGRTPARRAVQFLRNLTC